jgi:hypothetical protein
MKTSSLLLILVVSICLSGGCSTVSSWFHRAPAPLAAPVVAPAGPAAAAVPPAVASADTAHAAALSRIAAGASVIHSLNGAQPPSALTSGVEGEAAGITALAGQPSPADAAAAAQRELIVKSGDLARISAQYVAQSGELSALNSRVAAAEQARDAALASAKSEQEASRAKYQAQFDQLAATANARVKAAQDEANNKVMANQVAWLNRTAASCAALAVAAIGLGAIFGGITALRTVGPFAALLGLAALMAFGLAQIVGQWWFKWAVLSASGIGVAGCAWWVWQHYELGTLAADLAKKSAAAQGVLQQVVPVLDTAYESADATAKTFLDDKVFAPLSAGMDKAGGDLKAVVHTVRADLAKA